MAFSEIRISQQKNKDLRIESLRGIAILLVVAFHIIGYSPSSGIKVSDDSFWRYVTYTLEFVRLPLFVAISGFVYAFKPLEKSTRTKFLPGKARRLLIPFITVSTLQYLANTYVPATNHQYEISNIWRIYVYPWAQFWYLQAMAIVFVVIYLMERSDLLKRFTSWLLTLFVSSVLVILLNKNHHSGIFSFWGSIYIFPFFLLGIGLKRFNSILFSKKLMYLALGVLISGMVLQQLNWFQVIDHQMGRRSLITILMSLSVILILFRIRKNYSILSWLGYYSYGIYLFHVFAGSGSRIFLTSIGINNRVILFVSSMLMAVLLPILIERIILPNKWARFLLLGLCFKKKSNPSQTRIAHNQDPTLKKALKLVS